MWLLRGILRPPLPTLEEREGERYCEVSSNKSNERPVRGTALPPLTARQAASVWLNLRREWRVRYSETRRKGQLYDLVWGEGRGWLWCRKGRRGDWKLLVYDMEDRQTKEVKEAMKRLKGVGGGWKKEEWGWGIEMERKGKMKDCGVKRIRSSRLRRRGKGDGKADGWMGEEEK